MLLTNLSLSLKIGTSYILFIRFITHLNKKGNHNVCIGVSMTKSKRVPRRDKYQRKRGKPQFFRIYRAICSEYVLLYQKDGPGPLKRMYLDRIFEPEDLAALQAVTSVGNVPRLTCPKGHVMALPMIYQPEHRLAYLLIRGSFSKKKA